MTAPPDPLLAARAVAYRYGSHTVLRDVSLELHPGELLGVLGPNGAGKSTLLKLLAALLPPARGTVELAGRNTSSLRRAEIARRVAFVPQRERAVLGGTARDLVALGRAPHTGWFGALTRRDHDAVAHALARCDAHALADRPFGTLSGGEQKRVLIARALAQETPVILLDEPVAFLDIHHQLALCDLLANGVARGSFAAVVVLHDLNLAAQYCHRLVLLRAGHTVAAGPVADVMTYRRIREAFDAEVYVGVNELNGTRYFVPTRPAGTPGGDEA